MTKTSTAKALEAELKEEIRHSIECAVCGKETEETAEAHTAEGFAKDLERQGWIVRELNCLEVTGPCCPECAKKSEGDILADLNE